MLGPVAKGLSVWALSYKWEEGSEVMVSPRVTIPTPGKSPQLYIALFGSVEVHKILLASKATSVSVCAQFPA